MDSVIDVDDQTVEVDIENLLSEEREAIFSIARSDASLSGSSSHFDQTEEIDLLPEFMNSNNDDMNFLSFHDNFVDDESLDLCSYLGKSINAPVKKNEVSNGRTNGMSDLEILQQRRQEEVKLKNAIKTHVLVPVSHLNNNPGAKMWKTADGEPQCMSKNAVAARENRMKKKQYLSHLEKTVKALRDENTRLRMNEDLKDNEINKLKTEVKYLSNVLANQSALSALLQNIHTTPNVKFPTQRNKSVDDKTESSCQTNIDRSAARPSVLKRKHENADETLSASSSKTRRMTRSCRSVSNVSTKENEVRLSQGTEPEIEEDGTGGICLHVTGQRVSLEFCADCNNNSKSSLIYSDHSYVRQQLNVNSPS
ncbi:uncharacterized protein LOC126820452 [Patella vulgata]|uniref:uncharacterized protein LOC126820452 n=1 Tax=Patella vulgata TaxID=6465 RepID=UPI00217FDDD6|nr:uncharacterized protein LOC126820452 [Patella vulgata]